ncbi:MAG: septal ring lytic transglycosylase RlpA family protein [Thermodesulfobacteriota bacterium]
MVWDRFFITSLIFLLLLPIGGCGVGKIVTIPVKYTAKGVVGTGKVVTKGIYWTGKGTIGILTYPFKDSELEGRASWYGKDFHGKRTANGEIYDMYKVSAAHKTLPLGTIVRVKNLDNAKTVVLKINDRGPFVKGRIIDLSYAAAKKIGMVEKGVTDVRLKVLKRGR